MAVTKTSRNAFHSLRNERIAAGKTFPQLRDCCCLSLLNTGRRRTGKVFIIVSDRKGSATAGDLLNQQLKNKTNQKKTPAYQRETGSKYLHAGREIRNGSRRFLKFLKRKQKKKKRFNIYGLFRRGPNVLVVLTLMTPNAEGVQPETLEARRQYLPRDNCWRREEPSGPAIGART